MRAHAVTGSKRSAALPNVPTLKEQGINFYTWGSVKGMAAPKGTPPEIIAYYSDLFKKISEDPDFKKIMADLVQPIQYQNATEYAAFTLRRAGLQAALFSFALVLIPVWVVTASAEHATVSWSDATTTATIAAAPATARSAGVFGRFGRRFGVLNFVSHIRTPIRLREPRRPAP